MNSQLEAAVEKMTNTFQKYMESGEKDRHMIAKATDMIAKATDEIVKSSKKIESYIKSESEIIETEVNEQFEKEAAVNKYFKNYFIYNIDLLGKNFIITPSIMMIRK